MTSLADDLLIGDMGPMSLAILDVSLLPIEGHVVNDDHQEEGGCGHE